MKKIILILVFMSALLARGQDYAPISCEDCVWSVSHGKFVFKGDTLINELNYKKVFFHLGLPELTSDSLKFAGAFREEPESGKVWFIPIGKTDELLLYDFSLNINDEIHITTIFFGSYLNVYEGGNNIESQGLDLIVESVDNIIVNGESRKVIQFVSQFLVNGELLWIEGIGSSGGIIFSADSPTQIGIATIYYPDLLCVEKGGEIIYKSPFSDTCFKEHVTSVEDFKELGSVVVSFFNTNGQLIVQSNNHFIREIEVYDIMGRLQFQSTISSQSSDMMINSSAWREGLYLIKIRTNRQTEVNKVVKH